MSIVPDSKQSKLVSVSFRIPEEIRTGLEKVAEGTGNTLTDTLVYLLRFALKEYELEAEGKGKKAAKQPEK